METKFSIPFSIAAVALAFLMGSLQAYAAEFGTEAGADQSAYASVFNAMDVDDDGTLDKNELKNDKMFKDSFKYADANDDGLISQEEYTNHRRNAEQRNVKRIASDAEVVTRVKAKLVKEAGHKSMKINVDAYKGTVILSGFVDSETMAQQAEKVAKSVDGVQTVKNSLVVKDPDQN